MSTDQEPTLVISGLEEEEYLFEWQIEQFEKIINDSKLIEEQIFEIEADKPSSLHSKWKIHLEKDEEKDTVIICCTLKEIIDKFTSEVHSKFICQCKQNRPDGVSETMEIEGCKKLGESHVIISKTNKIDFVNHFVDADKTLTVYIQLTLIKPYKGSKAIFLEKEFQKLSVSNAKKKLSLLLDSECTSFDLSIVCSDGEEIKCHKLMLMENSPVFKTYFESKMLEAKCEQIEVTDISGEVMRLIIFYIYTGKLKKYWRSSDVIVGFTHAVGKYQIKELLNFLDDVLGSISTEFDAEVLFQLIQLARKLCLKKAEAELKEPIIKMAVSAKSTDDILEMFV